MGVIPQFVIEDWQSQYALDSKLWMQYPELEDAAFIVPKLVERDERLVRDFVFKYIKPAEGRPPIYIATAGAPLAGKTTILNQKLKEESEIYAHVAKIDPDVWGMKKMRHTYDSYLLGDDQYASAGDDYTFMKRAYDLARPGSNFLTLELLNKAVDSKYDIAHGTTMTSPHISKLLSALKSEGYQIELLLCGAEDEMRAAAQEHRIHNQGYYQSAHEEVINKGIAFPQRMMDYFTFADNLTIYWRDGVEENAIKAAIFENGTKRVLDREAYHKFVDKYNADRARLANPDQENSIKLPTFGEAEYAYIERFSQPRLYPDLEI